MNDLRPGIHSVALQLQCLFQQCRLFDSRYTAESQPIRMLNLLQFITGHFLQQTICSELSQTMHLRMVHQVERLRSDGADVPLADDRTRISPVEGFDQFLRAVAKSR